MTTLSDRDIEIGFWRFNKADESGFCPNDTYELPQNVYEIERLSLNLSTLSKATDDERKILKKKWYPLLPTLSKLKYLWLSEKTSQKLFDDVCKIKSLEGLWLKWTAIEDLENIRQLENLKHLYIGPSTKIQSLTPLTELKNLATIHLEGLSLISDFSCLTTLTSIEGLKIEGTMWKSQIIDTLKGFEKFKKLKYLSFINVVIADNDSSPIGHIKSLANLNMHHRWTKQDFQSLYNSLPNLRYGDVKSVVEQDMFKSYLTRRK